MGIRASVDVLCRDGTGQISCDPRVKSQVICIQNVSKLGEKASGVPRICEWGVFACHARRYAHAQKYFRTSMGTTGFRSLIRVQTPPSSLRSQSHVIRARVRQGTRGRKQRVLRSRPRATRMLINSGQGGCSNTQT